MIFLKKYYVCFHYFTSDDCGSCDQFVRLVLSFTPGCSALIGLIVITLFFESIFVCKRQGKCLEMFCVITAFVIKLNHFFFGNIGFVFDPGQILYYDGPRCFPYGQKIVNMYVCEFTILTLNPARARVRSQNS